jgi:nitroreductase
LPKGLPRHREWTAADTELQPSSTQRVQQRRDGANAAGEAYDEGRVTERLLIAARSLGLGGGVAWYGDADQQAEGKRILGIPDDRTARSVVIIGYPTSIKDPRPNAAAGGRKELSEVASYNCWGQSQA